jgi:hypothetical protein
MIMLSETEGGGKKIMKYASARPGNVGGTQARWNADVDVSFSINLLPDDDIKLKKIHDDLRPAVYYPAS